MGFVFLDTETTGLSHGFDQIVHFAAIRTDENLVEIERFEIRSRLSPHVVPHPRALLINGLGITQLTDPTAPSQYEMVRQIRAQLLKWSPSIFLGYGSIRFDEEMLRQALFQSLFPAYLTSNHGNGRTDVLGLIMAASAVTPTCLTVPVGPEGRPTFKLGLVAAANAVRMEREHNAMSDVVATLDLCRIVREGSSETWNRFVRFSRKQAVTDFMDGEEAFILTEFFGNYAYHSSVVCIGSDPSQANVRFCFDLSVDHRTLATLDDDGLKAAVCSKPSPVRRVRVNAAPAVLALYDAPEHVLNGADIGEIEDRAVELQDNPTLKARIVSAYLAGQQPFPPSTHLELQLYDYFPSRDDEALMFEFHDASWSDRLAIVKRFQDPRLHAFGLRLLHTEHRSVLPEDERLSQDLSLVTRLTVDSGGPLTLHQALGEIEKLNGELPAGDAQFDQFRDYLRARLMRVSTFLADRA